MDQEEEHDGVNNEVTTGSGGLISSFFAPQSARQEVPAATGPTAANPSASPPRRSMRKKFQTSPYQPGTTTAELDGSRSSLSIWLGTPRDDGLAGP